MIEAFSPDMSQRLADMQDALVSGVEVTCQYRKAYGGQPDRVVVTIGGDRKFVLPTSTAYAAGCQLIANGQAGFGSELRRTSLGV